MNQYRLLPVPAEDYDALGITPDSILETRVTDAGSLIVRAVTNDDLEDFICDDNCFGCYACCCDPL